MVYEDGVCQGCGGHLAETTVDDESDAPVRYSVEQRHCRGCERLHAATEGSEDKPGTQYYLERVPRRPGRSEQQHDDDEDHRNSQRDDEAAEEAVHSLM